MFYTYKTQFPQLHLTFHSLNRHARYFIAEHSSKKLAVGVEARNTLPIIEREELDIKLEICELSITPLFAVRWLKPYVELVRKKGGFSRVFKTKIYSLGFEQLTRTLYKRLELQVSEQHSLRKR